MSSRYKRKGKGKFLMLDGYLLRSTAWQALSAVDRAAYLELKWRYDGLNNGRITLGCRELADAIHVSKDTASRALTSLEEKGFAVRKKVSGFNVKNRLATEWLLTEYKSDVTGDLASKQFMRWHPDFSQSDDRDVRSDHGDKPGAKKHRGGPHGPTTGTVNPVSANSRSDDRDTYSATMAGAAHAA